MTGGILQSGVPGGGFRGALRQRLGQATATSTSGAFGYAIGDIKAFANPPGAPWLPCDGSLYSPVTYPLLAGALGLGPGPTQFTKNAIAAGTGICLGVFFLGGNWITLGIGQTSAETSTNRSTWATHAIGTSPLCVAQLGSILVAGGTGGIYSTPDGVTWTQRNATSVVEIISNGSLLFAFGAGAGFGVLTSPDGINWTAVGTVPTTQAIQAAAWGNGSLVVVSSGTSGTANTYLSTNGGASFSSGVAYPAGFTGEGIAWSNGLFVATGSNATSHARYLRTSPDGVTWTGITSTQFITGALNSGFWISVVNGLFFTMIPLQINNDANSTISTNFSYDGIDWFPTGTMYPINAAANGYFTANGKLNIVGNLLFVPCNTATGGTQWIEQTINTNTPVIVSNPPCYIKAA